MRKKLLVESCTHNLCHTRPLIYIYPSSTQGTGFRTTFNPLSPSIHKQILQTDLHTFPLRIG